MYKRQVLFRNSRASFLRCLCNKVFGLRFFYLQLWSSRTTLGFFAGLVFLLAGVFVDSGDFLRLWRILVFVDSRGFRRLWRLQTPRWRRHCDVEGPPSSSASAFPVPNLLGFEGGGVFVFSFPWTILVPFSSLPGFGTEGMAHGGEGPDCLLASEEVLVFLLFFNFLTKPSGLRWRSD